MKHALILVLMALLFWAGGTIYADEAASGFFGREVSAARDQLSGRFPAMEFDFSPDVHDWYRFLVLETLEALPLKHVSNLNRLSVKTLELELDRRAMMSLSLDFETDDPSVKLWFNPVKFPLETRFSCRTVRECMKATDPKMNSEFVAVLIHEIGHAFDLGKSTRGDPASGISPRYKDDPFHFYENDPSLVFYSICFDSESVLGDTCDRQSFPSQYSKTNAFEHFAEAMTAYVTDGPNFSDKALRLKRKGNDTLFKQYRFFKDVIFEGREYTLPVGAKQNAFSTYDTTKRRYSWKSLLLQY